MTIIRHLRTPVVALALASLATAWGCGEGAAPAATDEPDAFPEVDEWHGAEVVSIRECTCDPVEAFDDAFADWPEWEACLRENAEAVDRVAELLGRDRFVLRYLGPDVAPGYVSEYWYLRADGSGIHRWEQICDTAPSSPGCGWQSEHFEAVSARTEEVRTRRCGEEAPVEGVVLDSGETRHELPVWSN